MIKKIRIDRSTRQGKNTLLAILLFVALATRLVLFFSLDLLSPEAKYRESFIREDAREYHELAIALSETGNFENYNPKKVPGYPVTLAGFYRLFGVEPGIVVLFQLIANIITIFLLVKITESMFSFRVGMVAGYLYAFDPHTIFYSLNLMSEAFFLLLLLLATLYLLKALRSGNTAAYILLGFLFALAAYYRNIVIYLPFLFAVIIMAYYRIEWFRLKRVVLMLLVYGALLSPWIAHNYFAYGTAGFSTLKGRNLLFYNVALCEALETGERPGPVRRRLEKELELKFGLQDADPFYTAKVYTKYSRKYIFSHFWRYTGLHIRGIRNTIIDQKRIKMLEFYTMKDNEVYRNYIKEPVNREMVYGGLPGRFRSYFSADPRALFMGLFLSLFMILVYGGFLLGLFRLLKEKQYIKLGFLLLVIVYFLGLTGIVGLARYKLPVIPYYSIIAAIGLLSIRNPWRKVIKN